MSEVTLTVPAEYVEFFKLGVLNEIETDCGCLISNAQELAKKPMEWTDEDIQNSGSLIKSDLIVLSQLPEKPVREDVTVTAPNDGCLEHAAASTARSVVGPRLMDQLAYAPMAEGESPEILDLTAALNWAVTAAAAQLRERVAEVDAAKSEEVA